MRRPKWMYLRGLSESFRRASVQVFAFAGWGLQTSATLGVQLQAASGGRRSVHEESLCAGLGGALRTRHTLEPFAWHWSHWPGRLGVVGEAGF